MSGSTIDGKGLGGIIDTLAACASVNERLAVPGLDEKRADIVLGGALVLEQAFDALGIDEMVVSDYALREGVLLDAVRGATRPRSDTCAICGTRA